MLLPLLPLIAALDAPAEPPLLGRLYQARVDVHEMGRAELAKALSERGVQYSAHDSEDVLRIRLYRARAALLDSRSAHLAHAERVMNEATEHSTFAFLSGNTLDTSLTLPLARTRARTRTRTRTLSLTRTRARARARAEPGNTLDTILADDNAIFADTLGRGLLSSLHMHTAVGALAGLTPTLP